MDYTSSIFPWEPRHDFVLGNDGVVYVKDRQPWAPRLQTKHADCMPLERLRQKLETHERQVGVEKLKKELGSVIRHSYVNALSIPLFAAKVAANLAALDLGIPCPQVQYGSMEKAMQLGALGWTSRTPNIIYLKPFLCCCQAVGTSVHEVRHRYQFHVGDLLSLESDEKDARTYALGFGRRYLDGVRCGECGRSMY